MATVTILIGNSDNRLTQSEWAHFAAFMDREIKANCYRVHYRGGSDWDAPWQNACWVVEVIDQWQRAALVFAIKQCRESNKQDSAAIVVGDTQFV